MLQSVLVDIFHSVRAGVPKLAVATPNGVGGSVRYRFFCSSPS